MEFSIQEYWSGLPFPSPGDLPDPSLLHCGQILCHLSHQGSPFWFQEGGLNKYYLSSVRCVGHFKPYISHCKCHGDMEKSEQPVAFEMNRSEQSRLSSQPFASLGAIPPFLASQTYTRHTSQGGCSPSHRLTCRTWIHPSRQTGYLPGRELVS